MSSQNDGPVTILCALQELGKTTLNPAAVAFAVAFLVCHPRRGSAFVFAEMREKS
jgi:hypothetical protein